jgi:hypothetical protein
VSKTRSCHAALVCLVTSTEIAFASTSSSLSATPSAIPPWLGNRLAHPDLNHGPVAKYFQHVAHEGTPKAKAILVKADQVANALNLDDTLLDSLLVRRKLE